MKNSKLLQLYKTLEKHELREISKLLATPFFNKRKEVSDLFAYLKKLGAGLPPAKLKKHVVFGKIFPNKTYKDWLLRETMHRLCHAIEEYWLLQTLRSKEPIRENLLLEEYRKRQLDKQFFRQLKQQKARLEQQEEPTADHFIQKINLQHTEYFHPNSNKQKKETANILLQLIDDLDDYYLTAKTRYAYELKAYELLVKQEQKTPLFLEEILAAIAKNPSSNPLATQYQMMYLLLDKQDISLFKKLKNKFLNQHAVGKKNDRLALFSVLANFVGMRINQGEKTWNNDLLDLYSKALEMELLIEWGRLSQTDFANIVNLACALKAYDRAEQVIGTYATYLEPRIRESVVGICSANLYFSQGNFEQTLDLLQSVNFEDLTYKLRHRKLLIQCYFELESSGETQPLLEACSSYRAFLYRHQGDLTASFFEGNINFIKMVGWMAEMPYKKQSSKESLLEQLNGFKHISSRSWLEKVIHGYS